MPGITIGRFEHRIYSSATARGRATTGSIRQVDQLASDGKTIAMVSHGATTPTSTSVNVYYTTNYGLSWSTVPGTPLTSTIWATSADASIGGIYYFDNKWIVVLGDSRIAYSTNITSNWSTWTITGTAQTTTGWGNLSYSPTLDPRWVVRDVANNVTRVNSTTFGTWNTTTNGIGSNCEHFTAGRLGGADVWIGMLPVGGGIHQLSGSTFQTKTAKTYPGTVNGRALVYYPEESMWIAACDNQVIYTSPDSGSDFTWTARNVSGALGSAFPDPTSLIYIQGVGVVCGTTPTANTAGSNEEGRVLYSKNGTTWSLISSATDSVASYGYGFGGISHNGSALFLRAENDSGTVPRTANDGSWYTVVLVADR